jgi:hypothetical protein
VHNELELSLAALDCHLDCSDSDILVLRRQDGSFVAAFSVMGATEEGILEAAKEDYQTFTQQLTPLPTPTS